jgi:hypothetical protein
LAIETFKNNDFIIKENETLKKNNAALKNKLKTVEQSVVGVILKKLNFKVI